MSKSEDYLGFKTKKYIIILIFVGKELMKHDAPELNLWIERDTVVNLSKSSIDSPGAFIQLMILLTVCVTQLKISRTHYVQKNSSQGEYPVHSCWTLHR